MRSLRGVAADQDECKHPQSLRTKLIWLAESHKLTLEAGCMHPIWPLPQLHTLKFKSDHALSPLPSAAHLTPTQCAGQGEGLREEPLLSVCMALGRAGAWAVFSAVL